MDYGLSPDEMRVFLEETEEQLSLLEEDLLHLEKVGDDTEYQRIIQEIFRAAHTLKGSAAAIGHTKMASLTHAMETVLDKIRRRELDISSALVNTLLEGLDYLSRWKDEITSGEDSDLDPTSLVGRLRAFESGEAAPQPKVPVPTSEVSATMRERLMVREDGVHPYSISIRISKSCPMLSVRAFQILLGLDHLGEVVEVQPSREIIESDEEIDGNLLVTLLSPETPETVTSTLLAISDVEEAKVTLIFMDAPLEVAEVAVTPTAVAVTKAPEIDGPKAAVPGATRSHTIRVDTELLDNLMNLVGELVIDRTRLTQLVGGLSAASLDVSSKELSTTSGHIARISNMLQEEVMKARMVPIETLFKKFPRMVRDLSQKVNKEIDFILEGQETELDRQVSEEIGDPLVHLLRNALDHGVEDPQTRLNKGKPRIGTVRLAARQEENQIVISVHDDGAGIDPEKVKNSAVKKGMLSREAADRLSPAEAINLIFAAGLSTAASVSEVSGRGVGMDVVKNNIERLNGTIQVFTSKDAGSEFRIRLPLTLAILRALLVRLGEATYAIPLSTVTEAIRIDPKMVYTVNRRPMVKVRDKVLPLVNLSSNFGSQADTHPFAVLVQTGGERFGLAVDALVGEQEIVIKGLGKFLGDILSKNGNPGLSGATILGDGRVALILDLAGVLRNGASNNSSDDLGLSTATGALSAGDRRRAS